MATRGPSPEEIYLNARVRQTIETQRDYDPSELVRLYSADDIFELDKYQQNLVSDIKKLVESPLGTDFVDRYGERAQALTDNTTLYPEQFEDEIVMDPVMQKLIEEKRFDRTNLDITAAMRARRSVWAMIRYISGKA